MGDRTLQIWEVKRSTGQRKRKRPEATLDIAADGSWGPVRRQAGSALRVRAAADSTIHHIYPEPFSRSDHLVRLLTSQPSGGVNLLIERSAKHSALTIVRYKELRAIRAPRATSSASTARAC